MEMPIFSNPIQWSIELSIALIMVVGKLGAAVASLVMLPPIIGFLLAGMAIQGTTSNFATISGSD